MGGLSSSAGGWARSLALGGSHSSWFIVEVRFPEQGPPQTRLLYAAPKKYSTASQAVPIGPYCVCRKRI